MAPNATNEDLPIEDQTMRPISKAEPRKYEVVYWNIIVFVYYHIAGLYGLYLGVTSARWSTILYNYLNFLLACLGVIAGAHRLWSHRSYKARKPLQVFLMLCHSLANQHTVIHWSRDHRLHHKYSDTDADPHNASRGFFYSHVGWLFVKKHPEVKKRGGMIDVTDLTSNPVLAFQDRHNLWFIPLLAFVLPTVIPMVFFGESFTNAFHLNMLRYIINLNLTFTINSVAHLWGYRPYDKEIAPAQNRLLFYMVLGEGNHNYHHVFPWDYRSDEMGLFNFMTKFIDLCAVFGLAYDRKVADEGVVKARAERTGDGSVY